MGYGKTNEMAQILCFIRKRKIFKKTCEEYRNHNFKILWLVVKEEQCRRFFFFQRQSAPFWRGSSSNHDDDGNKNVTNSCYYSWACRQSFFCLRLHSEEAYGSIQCKMTHKPRLHVKTADNCNNIHLHIWQWKTIVVHALHVHFSFLYILQTFSLFPRREMTCFAVVHVEDMSIRWQMLNFVLLSMKRWFQINVDVGSLDENTKDSGTLCISDAIFIPCLHVFVWIRGMLCACTGATLVDVLCKRTQHCWTTLRWPRNSRNVGTCWLWSLTNFKLHPTTSNKSQQHTTWCANARNKLGPTMLRLVGQQCCERLHGSLEHILQA